MHTMVVGDGMGSEGTMAECMVGDGTGVKGRWMEGGRYDRSFLMGSARLYAVGSGWQ